MLGRRLIEEARSRQFDATGSARSGADIDLDLCDDASVRETIASRAPDLVINAAAMIEFAKCESDPCTAWAINGRAVGILADACRSVGAKFVQVSTDHFFSGDGTARHDEEAPVQLLNEYGRTKFAGEGLALTVPGSLVLRTNVTGPRDGRPPPTFFEWCVDLILRDGEAVLFEDYFSSTLSAGQFARIAFDLALAGESGRFNVACRDVVSKRKFVEALAERMGRPLTNVQGGSVRELGLLRAESSGLDVTKAEAALGRHLPTFEEVIEDLAALT